jgi:hypothetical protein
MPQHAAAIGLLICPMSQARKGKGGGGDDSQNRSVEGKLVQNITDISEICFARDCGGGVQVTISRSQVDT